MSLFADRFRAHGKTGVIGGPLANLLPDECGPHCDVLFEGEAEYAWPRFLREFATPAGSDHYQEHEKVHRPASPPRAGVAKGLCWPPPRSPRQCRGCSGKTGVDVQVGPVLLVETGPHHHLSFLLECLDGLMRRSQFVRLKLGQRIGASSGVGKGDANGAR